MWASACTLLTCSGNNLFLTLHSNMKNLLTILILLLTTATANAQKFDMFMAGGRYSDKPTNGEYTGYSPVATLGRELLPQRSTGYYFGLGGELSFGKKTFLPGVRVEVDYVGYLLKSTEYWTQNGSRVPPALNLTYNIQYVRIAPAFVLSRSFAAFRAAIAAGPTYNVATGGYANFLGLQGTISAGFKGIMLNLGYTHGLSTMFGHYFKDGTYFSSRAIFLGLSLYPQRFKK